MRCVLYLRMSSDDQERSIPEQREALHAHAAKTGLTIVGEYSDEGISGDATEKRLGFQRMIADCRTKRFEMVLCWDQDRFGRFDPLEAGFWIKPMRDAGVLLETVAQGRIDWNDFAGRLVWSVTQESKHAFLRDLAGNSLRGHIARAKQGLPSAGKIAFGYVVVDGRLSLDDDEKVQSVRRCFELRALGLGYWSIAKKLNEEGRQSPSDGQWTKDGVRIVVTRELYTGTHVFGRRHVGKYKTMRDGAVSADVVTARKNATPIKVPNAHPPIISIAQWNVVQQLNREPPKPHATSGNSAAPLAGLLVCGRCGSSMYSQRYTRGRGGAAYICAAYHQGQGCGCCRVRQDEIHEQVAIQIRDGLGGSFDSLLTTIQSQMSAKHTVADDAVQKKHLTKLDRQIKEAKARILTINRRLVTDLECQILDMMDQRERLAAAMTVPPEPIMTSEQLAKGLWCLPTILTSKSADPAGVRAALKSVFLKIVVDFDEGKLTKRGQGYVFRRPPRLIDHSSKQWGSSPDCTPLWTLRAKTAIRDLGAPRTSPS